MGDFLSTRHFSKIPKQKLREYAQKTNEAKRSPELKQAWAEQDYIRKLYLQDGVPAKDIAKMYKIKTRAVYRILSP